MEKYLLLNHPDIKSGRFKPRKTRHESAKKKINLSRGRLTRCLFPFVWIKIAFAQADILWRNLDQLVIVDIGNCLFQRHHFRRGQADGVFLARDAEVGQRLGFHWIDVQIARLGIFADNHAFVDGLR